MSKIGRRDQEKARREVETMTLSTRTPQGIGKIFLTAADHGFVQVTEQGRQMAKLLFGLEGEKVHSCEEVAERTGFPVEVVEAFKKQATSVAKGMQIPL